MNNSNHLKKKNILVQFSDGSSSFISFYIDKKEFLSESDIKSNLIWRTKMNSSETDNKKSNFYHYTKLFVKNK